MLNRKLSTLANSGLFLALLCIAPVHAQETTTDANGASDEVAALKDRVKQLEKRVEVLEQQAAKQGADSKGSSAPLKPKVLEPGTRSLYQYFNPQRRGVQAPVYQAPSATEKRLPDSWRPFQFNGMEYYTILIGRAADSNVKGE